MLTNVDETGVLKPETLLPGLPSRCFMRSVSAWMMLQTMIVDSCVSQLPNRHSAFNDGNGDSLPPTSNSVSVRVLERCAFHH